MYTENRRTCLTYSVGGHFDELERALTGIHFSNAYHVTWKSERFNDDVERYYVSHPRKSIWRTLLNAWQSLKLLLEHRPEIIISTGADVTVPTILIGKFFFRAKVIFVESAGNITPTLTGRLVYRFCDLFIVQWEQQKGAYLDAVKSEGMLL